MKKTKKKKITVEVPKSITVKMANTVFMYNNFKNDKDGLYFVNKKRNKTLTENELLCLTKKSLLNFGVLNGNKHNWMMYDLEEKHVVALLREIKKKKKYFKKHKQLSSFLIHLNPELSFLVRK